MPATMTTTQPSPNPRSRNALVRLLEIQQEYQQHKKEGLTDVYIWRAHIYPRWRISEGYFRRVLDRNVKRELAQLGVDTNAPPKPAPRQLAMF